MGGSTRDDVLLRMVGSSMLKHLAWPVGRPSPTPIKEGAFNIAISQTVMVDSPPPHHHIASADDLIARTYTSTFIGTKVE
jgi:hypothetical protein